MEDILEAWEKAKLRPQFKAENIATYSIMAKYRVPAIDLDRETEE